MYPRPDHFIVRPDMDDGTPGAIVPLIAVDQLPDWVQLTGVPRELDTEQIIGLINLGVVDKDDDSVFEVRLRDDKIRAVPNNKTDPESPGSGEGKAKTAKTKKTALPTGTKGRSVENAVNEKTLLTFANASSATEPGPLEQQQPRTHPRMLSASRNNTINNAVDIQARNISQRPLRPHMTEATQDKSRTAVPKHTATTQDTPPTKFCKHWCHHGSCRHGDQCWHEHCMPTTVEGMREVGLKEIPRWHILNMKAMLNELGDVQSTSHQQQRQRQPPSPLNHLIELNVPDQPSQDLHLLQGDISAPLASGGAQAVGPRTRTQGQQQQLHPHTNRNNYTNLHNSASVAANAAGHRRQAERQQQLRDDMPVAIRVRDREGVDNRNRGTVAGRAGFGGASLLDI